MSKGIARVQIKRVSVETHANPDERQLIPIVLTADTITDEQIRELCESDAISFDQLYRAVHRKRLVGESKAAYARARRNARARCAEILNARTKQRA